MQIQIAISTAKTYSPRRGGLSPRHHRRPAEEAQSQAESMVRAEIVRIRKESLLWDKAFAYPSICKAYPRTMPPGEALISEIPSPGADPSRYTKTQRRALDVFPSHVHDLREALISDVEKLRGLLLKIRDLHPNLPRPHHAEREALKAISELKFLLNTLTVAERAFL